MILIISLEENEQQRITAPMAWMMIQTVILIIMMQIAFATGEMQALLATLIPLILLM
jgi:hypothetical protein